ncbi:MAG: hypothetical protein A2Z37_02275 [Chloroflexi bacterium RBG_19FT_COMBO_62_14]|nr:MAG: hypothetical protein A2Z37_02275 [Chloroflexi bacterium RBG_19FT_COMBO_62_14]
MRPCTLTWRRRGALKGVATCLLNRALGWAKDQGYDRCAVDFEPMNPQARRFWTRHFDCVAYTLVRRLDALEADVREV